MTNQLTQLFYIFSAFAVLGLLIFLISFRFTEKSRVVLRYLGLIFLQIGVLGMIYFLAPFSIFIGVLSFLMGLFLIFDPFKIRVEANKAVIGIFEWLCFLVFFAVFSSVITGFPLSFWFIPVIFLLMPFLVPQWQSKKIFLRFLFWLSLIGCFTTVGYLFLQRHSSFDLTQIKFSLPFDLPTQQPSDRVQKQQNTAEGTQQNVTEGQELQDWQKLYLQEKLQNEKLRQEIELLKKQQPRLDPSGEL